MPIPPEFLSNYNGALDICLFDPLIKEDGLFTGMQILPDEWEDLFYRIMGVPKEFETPVENETYTQRDERVKKLFSSAVAQKGYPTLGRIVDIYADATFSREDIDPLISECSRALIIAECSPAANGLNKLLIASREAIKNQVGLILLCD
jgi:hypothetical protein